MQTTGEQLAAQYARYPDHCRADTIRGEIASGIHRAFGTCRVLSIDAWRDAEGWSWNNWHAVGRFPLALIDLKPRAMLREMRERGYLSAYSAGRVAIEDDGYNVVVLDRSTREPLFAIEYGDAQ